MKSGWKRAFLWSSLGSIVAGTVVALVRRTRATPDAPLECHAIPADCQTVSLWTEQFNVESAGGVEAVQDKYVLRVTPFKAWSVLALGGGPEGEKPSGSAIYHVTHMRFPEAVVGNEFADEGKLLDRFYGVVVTRSPRGTSSPCNHIARGGILEIRKCLVGGTSHGVETGEVHRSIAPILNFRFEYVSA